MHGTHNVPNKDMFCKHDCYCRFKLSLAVPAVHPLTKHTNQAKANIEGIVFWVSALHQLAPVSCKQQVGWVSLQFLQVLFHMFSQPLPQAHSGSAVRRRVEETGWQGAATSNPKTHDTEHARHAHTQTYTSVVCAHAHTHVFLFYFTILILTLLNFIIILRCKVVRVIHSACQEYKCKKRVIVKITKFSVQLSPQFLRWSSPKC